MASSLLDPTAFPVIFFLGLENIDHFCKTPFPGSPLTLLFWLTFPVFDNFLAVCIASSSTACLNPGPPVTSYLLRRTISTGNLTKLMSLSRLLCPEEHSIANIQQPLRGRQTDISDSVHLKPAWSHSYILDIFSREELCCHSSSRPQTHPTSAFSWTIVVI